MGMYDDCPCKNCHPPKRKPLCHSNCPDKAEWDRNKEDIKKKIQYEKQKDYHATGLLVDSQRRMMKFLRNKKG